MNTVKKKFTRKAIPALFSDFEKSVFTGLTAFLDLSAYLCILRIKLYASIGIFMVNCVPLPFSESISMVPPWSLMML